MTGKKNLRAKGRPRHFAISTFHFSLGAGVTPAARRAGDYSLVLLPLLARLLPRLSGLRLLPRFFPFAPPLDFFLPFACHLTSLVFRVVFLVQRDRPFHLCTGFEMDSS